LDVRWFKEDREKYPRSEQQEQIKKSEEALRNSSLLRRRLVNILEEDIEKTYSVEEDFDDPAWQRKTIAAAAERKTLRRIIKLLDLKEVKTNDR
jgi:phage gpG-like protein